MTTRKVRAWELIREDDGSETMCVEYADGTREEFRGVSNLKIEKMSVGVEGKKVTTSIPIEFIEIKATR